MPTYRAGNSGSIYYTSRVSPMSKGERSDDMWHCHPHDHTMFCLSGSLRVHREDGKHMDLRPAGKEFDPEGFACLIEAGVKHAVEALEDDTTYACVFAGEHGPATAQQIEQVWRE